MLRRVCRLVARFSMSDCSTCATYWNFYWVVRRGLVPLLILCPLEENIGNKPNGRISKWVLPKFSKKRTFLTPWYAHTGSMYWGITPPQKHHPPLSCQASLKWTNCPSPLPLFRHPPSILVFREIPPKSRIFQWNPKILKFFILNTIYLLKVT